LGTKVARFFISLKVAPQKMQFLGTIKKLASLVPWRHRAKWRKISRIDRHRHKIFLNPNCLGYFNRPWTGTNMHTRFNGLNKSWEKDLAFHIKVVAFLKSDTGRAKNLKPRKIAVSVFRCAFELTALFLKSFHLRLHCYTLWNDLEGLKSALLIHTRLETILRSYLGTIDTQ